jgi:hypothetical protein
MNNKRTKLSRLTRTASRGAVMVEYSFLLFAVALPAAAGLYAGGVQMAKDYGALRDGILKATP